MPQPASPLFRSAEGERLLSQHYDRMLALLPFPAHEIDVPTPTFGRTHVTVAGKEGAPPLMLWQGAGAPGPFMLSLLGAQLVGRYRIYAPDTPGQGRYGRAGVLHRVLHRFLHRVLKSDKKHTERERERGRACGARPQPAASICAHLHEVRAAAALSQRAACACLPGPAGGRSGHVRLDPHAHEWGAWCR